MEQDSLGRYSGKFPEATKHLKKVVLFFRTESLINGNSRSIYSRPPLVPVSGLRGRLLVNRTDLHKC